jgi:4-amino-4-deoxy-L-arabinose transferase-like glycosyltransferase
MRIRRAPLAVFLVALVLRLVWVLSASRDGFAFGDPLMYHIGAQSLLDGHGYTGILGVPMVRWPPGYSGLLAATFWLFGNTPLRGEILNAVIGALTVPLLYVTVRRAFNERVAMIAAVMLCVMPGPILWTDLLVTETVFTFLFVGFVALVVRSTPSWKWALGLGALVGLSSLIRGEALVWLLVPAVLWGRQIGWRAMAARLGAAVVVIAVVLTPWTIRNERVFHSFIPLALNSGDTLWAGHNPAANGAQNYPTDELLTRLAGDAVEPQKTVVVAKGMQHEAIQFMVHHPFTELRLIPQKVIALLRGDSYAFDWLNGDPYPTLGETGTMLLGTVADAAWFALLALCLLGVFGLGRELWRTPLLRAIRVSFITALVLYGFLYYGNYRYRLPYEPLMMVVAALVFDRMWKALRNTTTS